MLSITLLLYLYNPRKTRPTFSEPSGFDRMVDLREQQKELASASSFSVMPQIQQGSSATSLFHCKRQLHHFEASNLIVHANSCSR